MTTEQRGRGGQFSVVGSGSIWDGVAYWATLAGVWNSFRTGGSR